MSETNKKIISGFAWLTSAKFTVQILSWVSTFYVARILEPSDYGQMAIVLMIAMFSTLLGEAGLSTALIQSKIINRQHIDSFFVITIILGLIVWVILFFSAYPISQFFSDPKLELIVQVSSIGVFFTILKSVPFALLMRDLNFKYRSFAEVSGQLLSIIVVITMAKRGMGIWSLVFGYLVHSIIVFVIYLPKLGRPESFKIEYNKCKEIIHYGFRLFGISFIHFFWSKSDVFIIGKMLGGNVLGVYSMANQLASIPLEKIGSIFSQVAYPSLTSKINDNEGSRESFIYFGRYLYVIVFPLLIFMYIVAEEMILLLLTDKWIDAVFPFKILLAVVALKTTVILIPVYMNAHGKAGVMLKNTFGTAIMMTAAFYIGAMYGLNGLLYSWLIAYPIRLLLLYKLYFKYSGDTVLNYVKSYRSAFVFVGSFSIIMLLAREIIKSENDLVVLMSMSVVSLATYFVLFRYIFKEDLSYVLSIFKK